jgi:cell division protease FtsH
MQKVMLWIAIIGSLFFLYKQLDDKKIIAGVTYTQFMNDAKAGKIQKVDIQNAEMGGQTLYVTPKSGKPYQLIAPIDFYMVNELLKTNVQIVGLPPKEPSVLFSLLMSIFPILILAGLWFYMMNKMQGGGKGGAFSFGKSRARLIDENENQINFTDVAGCDEAKEEVSELVEFLKSPDKFQKLGGKIPRGVLLIGPPGTGKTLLAKAIAGEAKVPFFSISGSDFVEMFVGVGAARVRDMFEQAKKQAPCIIFIDEIDAVGRQRGGGYGGGNDEREQTLNQMLVEMDGFEANSGVIVVAATNRSDVLDKALLRPGRFDRQVYVGLPDIRGREQILQVHLRKIPIDASVDPSVIARGTPGFSGADLANLVNEAALFAARRNKRLVDFQDFEDAKDKIFMGPERKSAVMREEEKRATAYHESGHAIVASLLPKADPVHKVTIMPRGWALGVTWQLPEHDKRSYYYDDMLERMAILFGGRAAEEVFLNVRSTGASDDFNKATQVARDIVTKYGMTDALGPMVYTTNNENSFGNPRSISEHTQQKVDEEVRTIIETQYKRAMNILIENKHRVEKMVTALMEWETIDSDQIEDIMNDIEVRKPKYITHAENMQNTITSAITV